MNMSMTLFIYFLKFSKFLFLSLFCLGVNRYCDWFELLNINFDALCVIETLDLFKVQYCEMGFIQFVCSMCVYVLLFSKTCIPIRSIGQINVGFQGSQMNFIDNNGLFLLSNNSKFGFGFITNTQDVTKFLLGITYMDSKKVVWSANRGFLVQNSDKFMFDKDGNAYLVSKGSVVWSTNTAKKGVSFMALQDSGNLVLFGSDNKVIWESFSHPTDTLISNQAFLEGMKLVSDPNSDNLSYYLEIRNGDMILYAGYETPQPYWSMGKETWKTINKDGGKVTMATIAANSWRFTDQSKVLLWQFTFSSDSNVNATWIAVLGRDGFITFYNLQDGGSSVASPTRIPNDFCSTPEPCDPYLLCSGNKCECPPALSSRNCKTGITSPCNYSEGTMELVNAGDGITYFALDFLTPSTKTDLDRCKSLCLGNCSCLAMFFKTSLGYCFLLDRVGSLQSSKEASDFVSFIKLSKYSGIEATEDGNKHAPFVLGIAISTVFAIVGLLYGGYRYYQGKNKKVQEKSEDLQDILEEDNFLENISGVPVRFSYTDLQDATNNFSVKLGQGGFGSVYKGTLSDGTQIAVKKLEGIGQGKKEFRAEVSIIGSIHHLHLVKLRGFCAEGTHRLLVYDYMANGSLEKWIFKNSKNERFLLNWETRYNIALGTAKGLAYLHEDCDVKIIHCDIKPENVLLDENYLAKVSDFGLAKLMTRDQSHVFTTLRGTRGYLAPEWITNSPISEKSDVYSYGMVLLEIISGRKNFDPSEISQKSNLPNYAFKMMEEGKLKDILDSKLNFEEHDEKVSVAIKVALWCIQEDMSQRPTMTKVSQMLEGLCVVPTPPNVSQHAARVYASFSKLVSEEGTSSGPSDSNSEAVMSAVQLSGPR